MKFAAAGLFVFVLAAVLFGFQNCAGNKNINTSVDSASTDVPPDQDPNDPPNGNPSTCNSASEKYYFTVSEWLNPNADLYATAPVMGLKLATLRLDEATTGGNPFQGQALANGVGWRVATIRVTNNDGTAKAVNYFTKWDETNSVEKLNCYFGPVMPSTDSLCQNPANPPVAKMLVDNIGVGLNGVNGYIGYLSCPPKYFACAVSGSSKEVQFLNKTGQDLRVPASKAFIVKRGC